jgi:maleamate amidohydrolase
MSEDLGENYARAFGRRVGFGDRLALILIDMVEGYYNPECDLYMGSDASLASALRVRAAARAAGVPVILTNVVYHPLALNGGRFYEKSKPLRYFLEGHPMAAWPSGLERAGSSRRPTNSSCPSNIRAPSSAPRSPRR